ncbi:hypothetical protein GGX14DRAFT_349051 [Mycena pura]|uniref:protein-tyrosine-phosphatase n=1 Tax=Mycena pura TaxID=153505 RepID=A0AAD6YQF8_9AGAR|nr:hypothetical protein GGX14DRAFT_349051 [Mycena pura]
MTDFFSAVGGVLDAAHSSIDDTKSFADAIAARFGQGDNVLTARLLAPPLRLPNTPMSNLSIHRPAPQPSPSHFTALPPQTLSPWLDDPRTLVVDIRPHAAYSSARIARAVSLSVPSTLLKRPLFSLQRLSAMLPSASARARFSNWRSASRIVVYDADSMILGESSNINGLLRKFRAEAPDCPIALAWVVGGFQAVWAARRDLVDAVPPTPETETDDDMEEAQSSHPRQRILRAHHLPRAAFSLASTTQAPQPSPGECPPVTTLYVYNQFHTAASNPFYDVVRQNTELAHGITERIILRLPRRVRRRIAELPFEWLRDIARRAAPATPPISGTKASLSSAPTGTAIEIGTEMLAMQFYRIELAEQRRLMNVMTHHTGMSGDVREESRMEGGRGNGRRGRYPYSITAGVEKGGKNRYRNIWPFEHARVRLHRQHVQKLEKSTETMRTDTEHDDYVNASYVQPLGTRRHYIATQGPLETTFGDFWTLVWQQNVHVIVMLTREFEGTAVKCGAYWRPGTYGPLRVELLGCAAEGCHGVCPACAVQSDMLGAGGGMFSDFQVRSPVTHGRPSPRTPDSPAPSAQLIRRTIRLTHAEHPAAPPRRVVQLHYLGWPDMNVPQDARGVLGLVGEVARVVDEVDKGLGAGAVDDATDDGSGSDSEVDETTGVLRRALREGNSAAPVLLHCSAGVGRTGGFIAVDAILDAIRLEARELYATGGDGASRVDRETTTGGHGGVRRGSGSDSGISASMQASGIRVTSPSPSGDDSMDVDLDGHGQAYGHGNGLRTPVQVDNAEPGRCDMGETRRWAEHVADAYAPFASSSSTSLPSTAPSSVSVFPLLAPFQLQPPAHRSAFSLTLPSATSQNDDAHKHELPNLRPVPLAVRRGYMDQRLRTISEPSSAAPGATNAAPWPLEHKPVISLLPDKASADHGRFARSMSPFAASHRSERSVDSADIRAQAGGADAQRIDYKAPRALHARGEPTPVRISLFENPIWEVVQDMREQRMSLCQSLRQYIFVHAAIIEGALMVADEERARAGIVWRPSTPAWAARGTLSARASRPRLVLSTNEAQSTTGKRLASPTELQKEDKKGEIALSKRPSIKRKPGSHDDSMPPLALHTFPPP